MGEEAGDKQGVMALLLQRSGISSSLVYMLLILANKVSLSFSSLEIVMVMTFCHLKLKKSSVWFGTSSKTQILTVKNIHCCFLRKLEPTMLFNNMAIINKRSLLAVLYSFHPEFSGCSIKLP